MRNWITLAEALHDPWDAVDDFMADLRDLEEKHPNVEAHISDDDGQVYLDGIEAETKGSGHGSRYMTDLCKLLDRHGVAMELEPSPDNITGAEPLKFDRLGRWYEGFGFHFISPIRMRREPARVRLHSIAAVKELAPQMAVLAQKEYDAWDQDEDGHDEELGSGGICHLIAEQIGNLLAEQGVEVTTVSASDEVHVYCVVAVQEGIWEVDVPHRLYERGGGYTWRKVPGVQFEATDIALRRIDADPSNFYLYTDE